jgi:predicted DNA binding protein
MNGTDTLGSPSPLDNQSYVQIVRGEAEANIAGDIERRKTYEAEAQTATDELARLRQERDQRMSDIDSKLAAGFTGAPPKYGMGDMMQTMPTWMMIAAMAGSRGRNVGMTGISAINGMMGGLIKGDQMQYEAAQKNYDEARRVWNDYANHLRAIQQELLKAYGSDANAQQQAARAALRAAGEMTGDITKNAALIQSIYKLAEKDRNDQTAHADRAAERERKRAHDVETERIAAERLQLAREQRESAIQGMDIRNAGNVIKSLENEAKTLLEPYKLNPQKAPEAIKTQLAEINAALQRARQRELELFNSPHPVAAAAPGGKPVQRPLTDQQQQVVQQAREAIAQGKQPAAVQQTLNQLLGFEYPLQ